MDSSKPSVTEVFHKIVEFLEGEGVPYVLVGGLAAGLQGKPRYTEDVDLMITLPSSKIYRLAEAAKRAGFHIEPELAETQWRFSGFVRFWVGPPGRQVAADLMACNSEFLKEAAWRAQQVKCMGVELPVATPEDMLLFKMSAWRGKDISDAQTILARHRDHMDIDYVRRWTTWFASRHESFREMPARLDGLLGQAPIPPPVPWPST